MHYILTCLKAHYLMVNEKNYLVKDGQVFVVDEFTGRIMEGRRFNNGLHQAIEAKEGVKIKEDSKTIASITFQNLFNRYEKKCGMTGTAMTEEREFKEIYDLRVVAIPTNKPCIRVDRDDVIYKNHQAKLRRIVQEVQESYEKGQPVLVGTATIEQSEEISALLNELEIPHNVLNAKYHEKFDDIKIRVPKGNREKFKEFAESKGKSLNALIIELIESDMNGSQNETQSAGADTLEVSVAVPTAPQVEECENTVKEESGYSDYDFKCNICGIDLAIDEFGVKESKFKAKFCPNCGRRIKN